MKLFVVAWFVNGLLAVFFGAQIIYCSIFAPETRLDFPLIVSVIAAEFVLSGLLLRRGRL